uniref:Uncharacterized protein n=1 Tax=Rhizophora mucronata TaxID=61149 RepID=A0A2P2NTH8_RHIMU
MQQIPRNYGAPKRIRSDSISLYLFTKYPTVFLHIIDNRSCTTGRIEHSQMHRTKQIN